MATFLRPILQTGVARPKEAIELAEGPFWFDQVEIAGQIRNISQVAKDDLAPFRVAPAGRKAKAVPPKIMGILNVTPDSFSDGGTFSTTEKAIERGLALLAAGADILDIGGESTRPGAAQVAAEDELARVLPVIKGILSRNPDATISIDTRKSKVARQAIQAGAVLVNDVSALRFDPEMVAVVADSAASLCLMHARGTPETMQSETDYFDIVAEVLASLEQSVETSVARGIEKSRLLVDPGLGFAKTGLQNLELTRNLSAFHALGCPIVYGASRKKFIGTFSGVQPAQERVVGSVTLALEAARQAVQIVRVHDIAATKQAFNMWGALTFTGFEE